MSGYNHFEEMAQALLATRGEQEHPRPIIYALGAALEQAYHEGEDHGRQDIKGAVRYLRSTLDAFLLQVPDGEDRSDVRQARGEILRAACKLYLRGEGPSLAAAIWALAEALHLPAAPDPKDSDEWLDKISGVAAAPESKP
jgi:hypothetical protein